MVKLPANYDQTNRFIMIVFDFFNAFKTGFLTDKMFFLNVFNVFFYYCQLIIAVTFNSLIYLNIFERKWRFYLLFFLS